MDREIVKKNEEVQEKSEDPFKFLLALCHREDDLETFLKYVLEIQHDQGLGDIDIFALTKWYKQQRTIKAIYDRVVASKGSFDKGGDITEVIQEQISSE